MELGVREGKRLGVSQSPDWETDLETKGSVLDKR